MCVRPTKSQRPDSLAKIRCSFCFCRYGRAYNVETSSVVAAVAIVSGCADNGGVQSRETAELRRQIYSGESQTQNLRKMAACQNSNLLHSSACTCNAAHAQSAQPLRDPRMCGRAAADRWGMCVRAQRRGGFIHATVFSGPHSRHRLTGRCQLRPYVLYRCGTADRLTAARSASVLSVPQCFECVQCVGRFGAFPNEGELSQAQSQPAYRKARSPHAVLHTTQGTLAPWHPGIWRHAPDTWAARVVVSQPTGLIIRRP